MFFESHRCVPNIWRAKKKKGRMVNHFEAWVALIRNHPLHAPTPVTPRWQVGHLKIMLVDIYYHGCFALPLGMMSEYFDFFFVLLLFEEFNISRLNANIQEHDVLIWEKNCYRDRSVTKPWIQARKFKTYREYELERLEKWLKVTVNKTSAYKIHFQISYTLYIHRSRGYYSKYKQDKEDVLCEPKRKWLVHVCLHQHSISVWIGIAQNWTWMWYGSCTVKKSKSLNINLNVIEYDRAHRCKRTGKGRKHAGKHRKSTKVCNFIFYRQNQARSSERGGGGGKGWRWKRRYCKSEKFRISSTNISVYLLIIFISTIQEYTDRYLQGN